MSFCAVGVSVYGQLVIEVKICMHFAGFVDDVDSVFGEFFAVFGQAHSAGGAI